MLYFSSKPVVPDSLDLAEYSRLTMFKNKCKDEELFSTYESCKDLFDQIQRHLTHWVQTHHETPSQAKQPNAISTENTINEFLYMVKQFKAE
ncbi:hypothetical protein [Bacillus mycoides]|uniref:hypothetical protein n=1 Tax=Bacillus mycoides TaxID=1405 RepID=UPI0011A6B680|nr:hypothetical protein [Bacillus mycoides]